MSTVRTSFCTVFFCSCSFRTVRTWKEYEKSIENWNPSSSRWKYINLLRRIDFDCIDQLRYSPALPCAFGGVNFCFPKNEPSLRESAHTPSSGYIPSDNVVPEGRSYRVFTAISIWQSPFTISSQHSSTLFTTHLTSSCCSRITTPEGKFSRCGQFAKPSFFLLPFPKLAIVFSSSSSRCFAPSRPKLISINRPMAVLPRPSRIRVYHRCRSSGNLWGTRLLADKTFLPDFVDLSGQIRWIEFGGRKRLQIWSRTGNSRSRVTL